MKTFKKFLEECEPINEAEYNKEWWDSKSDSFKKRYIEKHPNSIYAQKAGASKTTVKERTPEHIDKEISAITSSLGKLMKQPGGASDSVIEGIVSKLAELQREKAAKSQSASAKKPEKSQLNARTNKPMPLKQGSKQVVKNAEKKKEQAEEGKPIAFDKMSKDQRAKAFVKLLNPKKFWVGQVVNPDSDNLPLEVIVDDDGKVIGFEDEETERKYGKEPTKADIANNKALEKWLGSKEYNEYFGED